MAIPKVCGIETEYGIVVRGGESNPVSASSLLINAYVNATSRKIGWDFEDETPANDARGFSLDDVFAPEVETSLVNAVLPNGARYYVDHAHPEISIPEVTTAGGGMLGSCRRRNLASIGYVRTASGRRRTRGFKNNSDGKATRTGVTRTT
jgi:proteasome accessory factor A